MRIATKSRYLNKLGLFPKKFDKVESYDNAKRFARKLKLKTRTEWNQYFKKHNLQNIPANPESTYDEWVSWSEFLGSEYAIATQDRVYLSYKEAEEFVKVVAVAFALFAVP